jgi:hypothetical protein
VKRSLSYLLLAAVFVVFSCQSGYAFWGKKKTDKSEEVVKKEEVKKQPEAKQEVKAEVKQEKPVEVKKQEPQQPAQPAQSVQPAISKEEQQARAKAKALKDKTKLEMDQTSWTVKIMAMTGEGKAKKDKLVFEDKKFYAESYENKGFSASNYTLTVKENGAAIWETMQSAEDGQIIFWRGEINPEMSQMRGVLSVQKAPGDAESFSFISEEKSPIKQ